MDQSSPLDNSVGFDIIAVWPYRSDVVVGDLERRTLHPYSGDHGLLDFTCNFFLYLVGKRIFHHLTVGKILSKSVP